MRISTAQIFDNGTRQMARAQAEVARAQQQISASKRILSPADDPAAATIALGIRQEQARSAQYQRNADLAEHELRHQDLTLESIGNLLLDVKDLAMQAGNATLSTTERAAIVRAIQGAGEELLALFNTRSASGDHLFAGAASAAPPFVTTPSGQLVYRGDEVARRIDVADGLTLQSRNSGRELFVDVPAAAPSFVARADTDNTGSAVMSAGRVVDPAAYAGIHPDDLVVRFSNPPATYTVSRVDHASGTSTSMGPAVAYVPGEPVTVAVGGLEVRLGGVPADGDEFVLEARKTQPIALTVQRLAEGLAGIADTPAGAEERTRVVTTALADLDAALQSLDGHRADVGIRLDRLDAVRTEQQATDLANGELASQLVDLDLQEAASRLTFHMIVLQAAQQSFAKIASLSLFSYLR